MTTIDQLHAAIQNGFDLLDRRAVMSEKMVAACRRTADSCEKTVLQDDR